MINGKGVKIMTVKEVFEKSTDRSLLTNDELWEIKFALRDRLKKLEEDMALNEKFELDIHAECVKENYKATKTAIEKIKLLL